MHVIFLCLFVLIISVFSQRPTDRMIPLMNRIAKRKFDREK